jgi:hypothetical protein
LLAYKMAVWQNGSLAKWQFGKMAVWQNGSLAK